MKSKMKKYLCLALALLTVLPLLAGCSDRQEPIVTAVPATNNVTPAFRDIDEVSLRDSTSIYADDDDTSVVTMYLTVSQGSASDNTNHTWADVNDHSTYYYEELGIDKYAVKGIFQVGDEKGPSPEGYGFTDFAPNCTVTIRGKSSSHSAQKSYKINLTSNSAPWRGQKTINLIKHVFDSTRMRNKIAYDLLQDIPELFSVRTQYVHLYVKDLTTGLESNAAQFEDYGLFIQTEQINKTYLRNHGLDSYGQLYKANFFEFLRYPDEIRLKTDPEYDVAAFESILEIKGNDDHSKLIEMLEAINNYGKPIEEVLSYYFDEENYYTWLAFNLLIGNQDTTSQNFFLYSPLNSHKWYFISWDNDGGFATEESMLFRNMDGQYNYTRGIGNYWGVVLHQRVLKSETCRRKLDEKMAQLHSLITKERVSELVNQYEKVVYPYISRMPDQMYLPRKLDQHTQIVSFLPREMDYQYEFYHISLKHPMPFFVNEPEVVNDRIRFGWNTSYDFNNEKISYTFDLARDPEIKKIIVHQENVVVPQVTTAMLEPGEYFFRVTATNASGMTQSAMEMLEDEDGAKYYGVVRIYVDTDKNIYITN